MDPGGVQDVGDGCAAVGAAAAVVADGLEGLGLPPTGDGLGLAPDLAAALAVWTDGVRALGTELGLLAERCEVSARGVEAEDESARSLFARRAASRLLPGAG